jgi:hypothetical protein
MAMSNLYSKIAPKPVKRLQDISVSQANAWMNGKLFLKCVFRPSVKAFQTAIRCIIHCFH